MPSEYDRPKPLSPLPRARREELPALPWLKILLILIVLGGGFLGARALMTWWLNPDYVVQRQMVSWADDAAAVPPDAPNSSTPSYHFDQFAEDFRRSPESVERAWLEATEGRSLPRHLQTRTEYIRMLVFMTFCDREREPNLARERLGKISLRFASGEVVSLGEYMDLSYDPRSLSSESPDEFWCVIGDSFDLADHEDFVLKETYP